MLSHFYICFFLWEFQLASSGGLQVGSKGVRRSSTLICAPIMAESVDKMLIDMGKAKTLGADLLEIRLDHLKAFDNVDLKTLIKESPLPTLFTYRYFTEDFLYDQACFMIGAFQFCCCSSISMLGI